MKKTILCCFAATLAALSVSSGAVTYTQTSGTGLTTSTATQPYELDDIQLAATTTIFPQQLTAMTFGYGVLAGTTAQTGAVFVDFYNSINTASTGSVLGTYIGGFGGTLTIAANTGTSTALRASSFSNLNTLTTPINFSTGSFAIVLTFTDSTGSNYSTVLTPLTSVPGTPTVGTSTTGVYRDTNGDGIFQATELNAALGNAYLSLTTVAVPEPSTWALSALGLAGCAGVVFRRRRAQA